MSSRLKPVLKRWVRANLMTAVVAFLVAVWLAVSGVVYWLERDVEGANITTWGDGIWWGIVTFLTVGYGDRYPVTPWGRFFGGILMLAGVTAVGIVTAKISSFFLERALREGRGRVRTDRLEDHFVVCGWKEEMHVLLEHILDFNPGLRADRLVMIANVAQPVIDALLEEPRLKGLQIVAGEYYRDTVLKKAAPERAKKVLILADRTPNPGGGVPSMTEVDARTIMTAMTLSNIARGTLVAAEILDPKMDQYLKLAAVTEIIYTREYSRLMLGNAAGGTGISNIIFDLLDPRTPTVITTRAVPEDMVGARFGALRERFERGAACSLIGVLENTGNSHRIKELALRQAQKTPDVAKLVQNLRDVKELKCNHPVFNPADDYLVPEGSMAIVIETRGKEASRAGREDQAA
jgi:voltage-gated potassium channel